jgi:hypothetical protein
VICKRIAVIVLAGLAVATPIYAITAGDVLNRMTEKEQFGYISGAVDMLVYLEQVPTRGSTPKSACILNWYNGKDAKGPRQVVAMFDSYQDKSAVGLIKILAERACGK